jgi:hypothetical protein
VVVDPAADDLDGVLKRSRVSATGEY